MTRRIALSDEVVRLSARVSCSECGKPSIYPDEAFMEHHLAHYADWSDHSFNRGEAGYGDFSRVAGTETFYGHRSRGRQ